MNRSYLVSSIDFANDHGDAEGRKMGSVGGMRKFKKR